MLTTTKDQLARTISFINNSITVLICIGCVYIIALPFTASLSTRLKALQDTTQGLVYETRLADQYKVEKSQLKPIPTDNRMVIPKIFVDGPIAAGDDKSALERGYWHRTSSVPGGGSNIVISGHRNIWKWTLFDLDKMNTNDIITIYWAGKEYNYKVTRVFETDPGDIAIEAPTDSEQLTVYTCTPVLTAAKRLVVIAQPI